MKKLISIVILSLCFFALANEINGARKDPAETFLCCTHPRLGAGSAVEKLDRELLERIIGLSMAGNHIVTASHDGTAKLWDLHGKCLVTFQGHENVVVSAAFN